MEICWEEAMKMGYIKYVRFQWLYFTVLQKKKFMRPKCDLYIVIDMDP